MKLKHIILVSLILAILTISAVNASEDIGADNLTANEITEDSISESDLDEIVSTEKSVNTLSSSDLGEEVLSEESTASLSFGSDLGEEVLSEESTASLSFGSDLGEEVLNEEIQEPLAFDPEDLNIKIIDKINTSEENWGDTVIVSIDCPSDADGRIKITVEPVGGDMGFSGIATNLDWLAGRTYTLTGDDLWSYIYGNIGLRDILVSYNGDTNIIARQTINISKDIDFKEDFDLEVLEWDYDDYVVSLNYKISGNVTVYVDGNECYNRHHEPGESYSTEIKITKEDLGIKTPGDHRILVKFLSDEYGNFTLGESNYLVGEDYIKYIGSQIDLNSYYSSEIARIYDSEKINGTISITIGEKEVCKQVIYDSDVTSWYFSTDDLNISDVVFGTNKIIVSYNKNDNELHTLERTANIYESPVIYTPNYMYPGQKEAIIVNANKDYTGNMTVKYRLNEWSWDTWEVFGFVELDNGFGRISLENLSEGSYDYKVNVCIDQIPNQMFGHDDYTSQGLTVRNNSQGYSSDISKTTISVGENITVTLNGNIASGYSAIFVDGKEYVGRWSDTLLSAEITDLDVGEHYIAVRYYTYNFEDPTTYSETYIVNVKPIPVDPSLTIFVPTVYEGDNVVIIVTSNDTFTGNVSVKMSNSDENHTVNIINGYGSISISPLPIGLYNATAIFDATEYFLASNKTIGFAVIAKVVPPSPSPDNSSSGTVNPASNNNAKTSNAKAKAKAKAKGTKLTLAKVKVKKSLKKLVIKATLKINGKAVKGKTLKFKFNKKSYKAKTNAKGIARITIGKKVLQKLKVKKYVKYQVSYGKRTVKRSVKVKK